MAPSAMRAHRADEPGRRRDGDEADDDGGRGADGGRLALARVVEDRPDDERAHRREERRDEREARRSGWPRARCRR